MHSTSSTPKARKRHWCEVCGWAIEPGGTYQRTVTFDGGDVITWIAHLDPCQKASNLAWTAGYDECGEYITATGIAEWAAEYKDADEVAAEISRRLKINAEKWRVRREAELAGEGNE